MGVKQIFVIFLLSKNLLIVTNLSKSDKESLKQIYSNDLLLRCTICDIVITSAKDSRNVGETSGNTNQDLVRLGATHQIELGCQQQVFVHI